MIKINPIGVIHSTRKEIADDLWLKEESYIELTIDYPPDALAGITDFSHVEVLFHMNQVDPQKSKHRPGILVTTPVGLWWASSLKEARTGSSPRRNSD